MRLNSKYLALLLSSVLSLIILVVIYLFEDLPMTAYILVAGTSFTVVAILLYLTLELLVVKEIKKLQLIMVKQFDKEDKTEEHPISRCSLHPIWEVYEKIAAYVVDKEQEIRHLKKLEAYRKEFLADISHELKTPIFAAQGYILTLLDGAMDDIKVKEKFLKKAAKSLDGLDAVVQDILTISQIESGVIKMTFEVFDLTRLINSVIDQLESKAAKKNITLLLKVETTQGVHIYADYNRINQVFINLINNGIKYNKKGGWVKVILTTKELIDAIEITVMDNGQGIPTEHLSRVFERFYRVEKSRSKKRGGSGLGLAIVKHILECHHSNIGIESETSKGTTFKFTLKKAPIGDG